MTTVEPTRNPPGLQLHELAAAAHLEAARTAELAGHPAAARRHERFAVRVRQVLRDLEAGEARPRD